MEHRSLAELFLSRAQFFGDRVLYRFASDGHWKSCTWREAHLRVRQIALGLASLEIKKGDRVAIFSANRVEWSLIDWANICLGALTVPIYSSSTPSQVRHILEHSGCKILFVESPERLAKLNPGETSLQALKKIVLIDASGRSAAGEPASALTLDDLETMGKKAGEEREGLFDERVHALRPEDDLTIIYTSGTTGEPKGVLTTHANYLFMIDAVDQAIHTTDQDVTLQFLPFAHSFGRLEHFMVVAKGYTCGFARSLETVARDLLTVRPTILFSVPRIYENAYDRIRSRAAAGSAIQRKLFDAGCAVGGRISGLQQERKKIPWHLRITGWAVRRLVFSKIQSAFGGRLRLAISGGAALSQEIGQFFHTLGILVLEGYGLTESSTVSHVNRLDRYKFGTVGLPLNGVGCRIGLDGEVLLRGPNIFKGYYRDPEGTREVVDPDGWFHTGDIGQIDGEGFLKITGRKKDLIVTSGGKKVAPQMIEELLKSDPLISQAMVFGDGQKHVLALITLDRDELREWGKQRGLELRSLEEAAAHPQVVALVKERIRQKNKELASFEAVRAFRVLPRHFTVENEELTPTLKLRRQVVLEHYREVVEEMSHKI